MDVEGILRSRFQTTAFFLGAGVTDSGGRAVAAVKLPDNLTTFRVMAVALTAGGPPRPRGSQTAVSPAPVAPAGRPPVRPAGGAGTPRAAPGTPLRPAHGPVGAVG